MFFEPLSMIFLAPMALVAVSAILTMLYFLAGAVYLGGDRDR